MAVLECENIPHRFPNPLRNSGGARECGKRVFLGDGSICICWSGIFEERLVVHVQFENLAEMVQFEQKFQDYQIRREPECKFIDWNFELDEIGLLLVFVRELLKKK